MDVVVWLRSLGLGKRENEIDETVLPNLTVTWALVLVAIDDGEKEPLHSLPVTFGKARPSALAYVRPEFVWEMSVRHYLSAGKIS
jgi:hypothetical protein